MKKLLILVISMMLLSAILIYGDQSNVPVIGINLLNQEPNPARSGDTVNLRFKIENTGGEAAKNLDIELVQNYPFTIASGAAIKTINNLDAYTTGNNYVNLEYIVKVDKDAKQGDKELDLRYRIDNGAWITVSFTVSLSSQEFAQIIYVDKAKLEPGTETNMTFTINNIGNAPLQNLVFSWSEATGVILPIYSGDSKYIRYLDAGQSIDLAYKVVADVNAKPGLYQLDLTLKYESTTDASSSLMTTKAGVFVGGQTDFDVAFSESSAGQTSLSVANTGNNPAQSVSVSVPQQNSYRVTGSNSAIIGNLDKGDYTLVSFQIVQVSLPNFSGQRGQQPQLNTTRARANATQDNNLRVLIQYTDTTGKRQSVEKNVPIQFRATTGSTTATSFANGRNRQNSSFIGSIWFWVLIILIVIAGYVVLKKKSRREKIFATFHKKR